MLTGRIGFIGLGNLGMPMAIKVAEAGFDLMVYDLRAEAVAKLVNVGAKCASSPAELAKARDIIELMVVSADQIAEVCLSPSGILSTARRDTIIVIHSTVGPAICNTVAAAAKERGVHVIDAGVSGGPTGAAARTMSLMVGGPAAILDRCRPLFAAFASNVYHIGENIGSGQIAKALNNHAYFCNLFVVDEILKIAKAAGVPVDTMLNIVNTSSGQSWASEHWRHRQEQKAKYTTGPEGLARVTAKDLSVSLSIAHEYKVPAPAAALALEYAFEE